MSTGSIYAWFTATKVSWAEGGTESYGWVDWYYDQYELCESRNYVRPEVSLVFGIDDEWFADEIADALGKLGAYVNNGDGTFYGQDEVDREDGSYTYALHFKHKYFGPNGWVEVPWNPADHGFDV